MRLVHNKGRFGLTRVLAGLSEVDRISRLADNVSLLNLPLVPLSLPNHIVRLRLRSSSTLRTAIIQTEVALLHTVPRILLSVCATLQSLGRRRLVHRSRIGLRRSFVVAKNEVR